MQKRKQVENNYPRLSHVGNISKKIVLMLCGLNQKIISMNNCALLGKIFNHFIIQAVYQYIPK